MTLLPLKHQHFGLSISLTFLFSFQSSINLHVIIKDLALIRQGFRCFKCIKKTTYSLQGPCDGLNENVLCRLLYLNTWFSVGDIVWEGLKGLTLLEEVCLWSWALKIQSLVPFPLFPDYVSRCEISACFLSQGAAACNLQPCCYCHRGFLSGTIN